MPVLWATELYTFQIFAKYRLPPQCGHFVRPVIMI